MAKSRKDLLEVSRSTEVEASRVLDEARTSGLSLGAFAEEHGLVPERLYRWARKLGAHRASAEQPGFAEVTVVPRRSDVEIELRSGRVVRISSEVDPGVLCRLLDAIEGDGTC